MSPRHSFMYEQTDVPEGVTLTDWCRERTAKAKKARRPRGLARLLRPARLERARRERRVTT